MAFWTFYFAAKLYLFLKGAIRSDVLQNVLFLILLLLPAPRRWQQSALFRTFRVVVSVLLGLLLLWRESWLPSLSETLRLLQHNGLPSREYLVGFLMRFLHPADIAIAFVILGLCAVARTYRKTLITLSALIVLVPLFVRGAASSPLSGEDLNKRLAAFYDSEYTRMTRYTTVTAGKPSFDIILLHVCSLSWDDLAELGMENHPLFRQFDILFTHFNTVSTYSNPSVIRFLNANCGQRRHQDEYGILPRECSLVNSLAGYGYTIAYARNHNGSYGRFDEEVRQYGRLSASAFPLDDLVARKYMFDDSPVYDDWDVLKRWWENRNRKVHGSIVLYYNTVSLHDGSHWIDDKEWWKRDHKELYRVFLTNLLDDTLRFVELLSRSGRPVLFVFLGEHGRAVRGSAMETPGLRDVPLPRVTLVPCGVRLINGTRTISTETRMIRKPVSYIALSYLLSTFMEQNPFDPNFAWTQRWLDGIPQTDFVSENEGNIILQSGTDYYWFGKENRWLQLSDRELR